ncbi:MULTISPECIES: hypothetical protein [Xanthomonas]|uniref:hypothetical protein n=1 Tax=Xanthomonas TaxID=338 RepID=UPI000C81E01B|nr:MULTISPECIES: hypothetical protein [Xanthomonas]NIK62569.1 hypothetical protein [Xanthomonas cannabis]PPT23118.1 hypothetical protein XarCFBP6771_01535 [Xanthomonas arboricola]SOU10825.1 hypothetical protein LMG19145_01931 [Xanthomonas arboricola pv. fragariae]
MLPDGFYWTTVFIGQQGVPRKLALSLTGVARMERRVDNGAWYIYLDYHLQNIARPARRRDCSSFEAGMAGAELWVCRHEARLRAEVAQIEAAWPKHCGAG